MKTSAEQINMAINGYTDVLELSLYAGDRLGAYDLHVRLANAQGSSLVLSCRDVSKLQISDFGGGLTQFLALRCDDVREIQLDRVALHFADLERRAIVFDCLDAQLIVSR